MQHEAGGKAVEHLFRLLRQSMHQINPCMVYFLFHQNMLCYVIMYNLHAKYFQPLFFFVSVLSCKGLKKQKVNAYFVSLIHITSTVLLLLLQAKAHTHTTQVKAPFTEGTRVFSFPF